MSNEIHNDFKTGGCQGLRKSLEVINSYRNLLFRSEESFVSRSPKLGDCACALCMHLPKVAHLEESVKKQF